MASSSSKYKFKHWISYSGKTPCTPLHDFPYKTSHSVNIKSYNNVKYVGFVIIYCMFCVFCLKFYRVFINYEQKTVINVSMLFVRNKICQVVDFKERYAVLFTCQNQISCTYYNIFISAYIQITIIYMRNWH